MSNPSTAQSVPTPQPAAPDPAATTAARRNFLRFWAGQTLSEFGTRIGAVGMPVIAVDLLRADNQQVGILSALGSVGFLLFGLPAGAWIDRWLKRHTMIIADLVRLLAVLAIPLLWTVGELRIWHLYVVSGVVGLATVFFDVAYQSYIPVLVTDQEIGRANARLEATAQLATTGGPALGGLLMRVLSAPLVMLSDAFAYTSSVVTLALTRDTERRRSASERQHRSLGAEIAEGLRFVGNQPVIRRLVLSMGFSAVFANVVATLLPILVLRQIGLSAFMLGVVMTFGSIGGAIGAMMAPRLRQRFSSGLVIAGGLVVAAMFCMVSPLAALAGRGDRPLATVLLIVSECGMVAGAVAFNVTQVSLRQRLCPKNLLGRMNASIRFAVWGSTPIAAMLAGWLGTQIGVVPTMWIGSVGALLTVLPVLRIGRLIPADLSR